MLQLVAQLFGLGSLVCFIIMVIPLFKEKGVLHGILGILCGLYTFIWGWMNAERLAKKQIMLIWTGLILGGIVLNVLVVMSATSAAQP
ncbi:MAG: hypothetical protein ABMA13_22030 [Chthoniobacteraceae bacterium]